MVAALMNMVMYEKASSLNQTIDDEL